MLSLGLKLNTTHLKGDSFLKVLSEETVLFIGEGLHLLPGKKHGNVYVHFLSMVHVLVVLGLVVLVGFAGVLGWGEGG